MKYLKYFENRLKYKEGDFITYRDMEKDGKIVNGKIVNIEKGDGNYSGMYFISVLNDNNDIVILWQQNNNNGEIIDFWKPSKEEKENFYIKINSLKYNL